MDYARFERLAIGIGAVAIVATAFLALSIQTDTIEFVAQLLLLAVLVAAVRWGRRGGTVTAVAATAAYLVMRMPQAIDFGPGSATLALFAVRAGTYGLLGIVGGELCTRMKYIIGRAGDDRAIDESTRIYTPRFMARLLCGAIAAYRRYGDQFSIVTIEVDPTAAAGRASSKELAAHLREELRLADDIGSSADGAFVVLLRQTAKKGAEVTASRLEAGLRDAFGLPDHAIKAKVLGIIEEPDAVRSILDGLSQDDSCPERYRPGKGLILPGILDDEPQPTKSGS